MPKITNIGSPEATRQLGERTGASLRPGDILALYGDLGAGKTTFAQGIAKGLGVADFVTSPSFVIINKYSTKRGAPFYHIDLYRLTDADEIQGLGLDDLFKEKAFFVVEWAERIENILPKFCTKIYLDFVSENERKIRIEK